MCVWALKCRWGLAEIENTNTMNETIKKLKAIRAKCEELLAIAEKRTPGEWRAQLQDPNTAFGTTIKTINSFPVAFKQEAGNAAFIASCTRNAEAGWRSTIAAIDLLLIIPDFKERHGSIIGQDTVDAIQNILRAWKDLV